MAACKYNIWGIENIANLDKLPTKGFTLYNMVMKIELGSGAPGRVFATMPGQEGDLHQEFHNEYCKKYHASDFMNSLGFSHTASSLVTIISTVTVIIFKVLQLPLEIA